MALAATAGIARVRTGLPVTRPAARRCAFPGARRAIRPVGSPARPMASSTPPTQTFAPTPTTTTKAAEDVRLAAELFLPFSAKDMAFTPTTGGVNNIVYYVDTPKGERFVLRVYNNGLNSPRVKYEHAVLQALAPKSFSFEVPRLLPAIRDGHTMAALPDGAEACLFACIPGAGPKTTRARAVGRATAELVAGMADVRIPLPCPNPLYRNMYEAHHKMTRFLFFEAVKGKEFDGVRENTTRLVDEILKTEAVVERINGLKLREQQIHADLHFENLLADGDRVSGILDFEFSAPDWTVMELAVGLSKYVATPGAEDTFTEYVRGYGEAGKLTRTEIELVPSLIVLRILSNVIYFTGRGVFGEDSFDALTTRCQMYADRCKWVEDRKDWIVELLAKHTL